jgi:hypothetical protein
MIASRPGGIVDPKMTAEAFIQSLADIPCFWLRKAAWVITNDPSHQFLPNPGVFRYTVAKLVRAERERISGEVEYSPHGGRSKLNVSREITKLDAGPEANGMLEICAREMIAGELKKIGSGG